MSETSYGDGLASSVLRRLVWEGLAEPHGAAAALVFVGTGARTKDPLRAASTGLTPGKGSELQVPARWEAREQKYQNPPLRKEWL